MEEWRAIIGFEGTYEISNEGRCRRIAPSNRSQRKLADKDIQQIFKLAAEGKTQTFIAGVFSIPQGSIANILSGKTYRSKEFKVLSPQLGGTGYFVVCPCINGKAQTINIHAAVAAAFIGPRPDGAQINHIDGDRFNNKVENLEYCTASENTIHAFYTLKKAHKLNPQIAAEIREKISNGATQKEISAEYGISSGMASHIATGRAWGCVEKHRHSPDKNAA